MRGLRLFPGLLATAILAAVAACATTPSPGDPDYPYNVEGAYRGTLALTPDTTGWSVSVDAETLPDGTLTGRLAAVGPDSIVGDFSGSLRGDSLVWRSSWMLPRTGCRGLFRGWGAVEPGGNGFQGTVRSRAPCGPGVGMGSFRVAR